MTQREKEIRAEIARHAAALAELVDSVQIVVAFKDDDGSHTWIADGAGSYYERRGAVDAWVREEKAFLDGAAAERGRKSETPPEDDGDAWKGGR